MRQSDRITKEMATIPPTTRNRVGYYIAYGAMAVLAIAVGILLYWSFQDGDVLVVKNAPFPVRTITDVNGDKVVILHVDYCKTQDVDGQVRISYVSQTNEVLLPLSDEKQSKGCVDTEIPILVPKNLPPNRYRIKFRATYHLNPLKQSVVSEFESQEFSVEGQ